MRKHHPANERIKRRYFAYLEDAHRMVQSSVDQVAAAIAQFEESTRHRDFKLFHIEQAKRFKRQLQERTNPKTGKPLAKATLRSRLMALKAFFRWLAGQPGYKSRISYPDADYFNPTANDERITRAVRERPAPTPAQIRRALEAMPSGTALERRDRAVFAFAYLSGARDDAIASLKLRHVDLGRRTIDQDAREVRTKARKTFTSWFFPVGEDIAAVVCEWIAELIEEHQFEPDDPLFPATETGLSATGQFTALGLSRRHWSNASTIRQIFKAAFKGAGLAYFSPHSFRKTLTLLGERRCRTAEEFKAWSQNLGHEHVLTTLTSYGKVGHERQGEILSRLSAETERSDTTSTLTAVARRALEALLEAHR